MKRLFKAITLSLLALLAAVLLFTLGWSWWVNGQVDAMEVNDHQLNAPGQFVQIDDFELHYQLRGQPLKETGGVPVLMLHGFSSSGGEFARLAPLLEGAHALLLPDLLGFGHSQRVMEPGAHYSHPGQVRLLIGLLEALGVAQVDIIGSSYGGAIASQLALEHPERVRRLVLMDAQVFENSGGAAVADLPFGLNRALTWFVLGGGPGADAVGRSACAPESTTCLGPDLTLARARITSIKGYTEALLAFSHSPRNARVPAELSQITQATLVIWGRQDGIIAPEFAEKLMTELPNARLEWIENAGHVPHIEQPNLVAPLILQFLGVP